MAICYAFDTPGHAMAEADCKAVAPGLFHVDRIVQPRDCACARSDPE